MSRPSSTSRQTVTIEAGKETIADDFANSNILNGSLRGTVWNDLNRNGVRDKNLTGEFTEPGLQDWTVYLDLEPQPRPDPLEPPRSPIRRRLCVPDLQMGEYEVREIVPTGWEVAPTFSDNETVTVYSGTESLVPDFANFNLSSILPGSVERNRLE